MRVGYFHLCSDDVVSMESGLRDRNNYYDFRIEKMERRVSMESGLRDRNNWAIVEDNVWPDDVSMESGLRDRNNGSPRKAVLTRDFTNVCERCVSQAPASPLC